MIWETVVGIYLVIGFLISWAADIGHKRLYDSPQPWTVWVAGTIGWPIMFLVGGRKR